MFYPNLLNISKSDLVLEVGPGAYPHWRSDCLVDRFENASDVDLSQFGGAPQHTMGKPLFLIDDAKLPFRDGVFDYLICAQVLEHVPSQELPSLISEICRVAKRAYIEVPRPVFDLVYDFDVHLNLMDIVAGTIVCLPKEKTNLKKIKLLTQYALELRKSQGFSVERNSFNAVAVGMEFSGHIPLIICDTEEEFFQRISKNIVNIPPPPRTWIIKERLASFFYRHVHKQYAKSELLKLMINQD
jgi:Methyltransferase domain